jgi:hypothetical protein
MTIEFDLRDCHGDSIELGQRVALRVHRVGVGSHHWQRVNKYHFCDFWLPGIIEVDKGRGNACEMLTVRFTPDREAMHSLEQPMGNEQEAQNVDHLNQKIYEGINIYLNARNVPTPGTWKPIAEAKP